MSDFYSGRRALVTGGLGFIGSNLALRLVERGARVTLVDSMIPAYGANLHNIAPIQVQVAVNYSDIRDRYSLSYLVRNQDILFSLAGQVSHLDSMQDPLTDLDVNCRSQLSLLECCRHSNPTVKIVFASTRQIYGRPQYLPVNEDHPLAPVDVNGVNKLAAELYYTLYDRVYEIRSVSLRLTNTYGPRMDLINDQKGFMGIFLRKALSGESIKVFGTGEQRRDFNYVDDVVDALLLAGENDNACGRSFNLGHHEHHSLLEVAQVLGELTGCESTCVAFPQDRAVIDIGDYYGDYTRFRDTTGWVPKVDLKTGLARTIAFFRENSRYYGLSATHDQTI
ncbi:MAG: NAD-dependent epimerase/dehydratase family protein [Planctomycetia bacterium]|nr:NAD-dependent epimerase/dehydratase family protein [Planctomycetia bacterium]